MKVRFWGTRGSIPAPGPETSRYGGNTTCVEISSGKTRIIFDAGTGIRKLGYLLKSESEPIRILFTHFHWDHIQGLPFFIPLYIPGKPIEFYAYPPFYQGLKEMMVHQLKKTYFPAEYHTLPSLIKFFKLKKRNNNIGPLQISVIENNHPGGATGYRISDGKKVIVFLTDNELKPPEAKTPWSDFVTFSQDADILIHDAQYNDEELKQKPGWGHSSYSQVCQLALEAKVKQLIFTHHEPVHSDDFIDDMVDEWRGWVKENGGGFELWAASEGEEIEL
ncbi:MBL fold metallo-hydrolase [candidate division WOR-3 bacterium]|uniref:MBL fold metallo-hydrolase n=1 Tax=candidate division WOR-3 bacterium TaxID=2052148 RepID=A0A660SLJ4_UNCW3|nr:MAG: MBL fold metallo-hydrolase [candidate division WOR-3 bacterium]